MSRAAAGAAAAAAACPVVDAGGKLVSRVENQEIYNAIVECYQALKTSNADDEDLLEFLDETVDVALVQLENLITRSNLRNHGSVHAAAERITGGTLEQLKALKKSARISREDSKIIKQVLRGTQTWVEYIKRTGRGTTRRISKAKRTMTRHAGKATGAESSLTRTLLEAARLSEEFARVSATLDSTPASEQPALRRRIEKLGFDIKAKVREAERFATTTTKAAARVRTVAERNAAAVAATNAAMSAAAAAPAPVEVVSAPLRGAPARGTVRAARLSPTSLARLREELAAAPTAAPTREGGRRRTRRHK